MSKNVDFLLDKTKVIKKYQYGEESYLKLPLQLFISPNLFVVKLPLLWMTRNEVVKLKNNLIFFVLPNLP